MKYFILFGLIILLPFACNKERDTPSYYVESLRKCVNSSFENNPEAHTAEYVEFNIAGKKILFNDGENGYRQVNTIAQTFTTQDPVLNPNNDSSRQYLLKIGFDLPAGYNKPPADQIFITLQKKENLGAIGFIDKYIREGNLKLRQKPWGDAWLTTQFDWEDGFEINYWCAHCCDEHDPTPGRFAFTSAGLNQKGFLRCTRLSRIDLGASVRYHIEFEFACELYGGKRLSDTLPVYETLGAIEDGKMVVDFVVEK